MSCHVPGHVIVSSTRQNLDSTLGMIGEYIRAPIEVAYSIADVLAHYHLTDTTEEIEKTTGPLPFVARVPEGEELELASQISRVRDIRCSCPDFYVRPTGADIDINDSVVEEALRVANLLPIDPGAGDSTRIAILDTGVNPGSLIRRGALHSPQYNAEMRCYGSEAMDLEDVVGHGTFVAHIINRVSPAAELLSVRVMGNTGSIGSVLAGVYLAEAAFRPDVFNLSLSLWLKK